jgi:hypothetical protein
MQSAEAFVHARQSTRQMQRQTLARNVRPLVASCAATPNYPFFSFIYLFALDCARGSVSNVA